MKKPPIIPGIQPPPSRFPLWWVLGANALSMFLTVEFYWIPKGMYIRPMAWAAWVLMLAAAGLIGIPMALPALRQNRHLFWPWLTVVLSIFPYPLAMLIFSHAQHLRGFITEP